MTDDNADNPWAPPVPVEEETQKPTVAGRYWSVISFLSAIPLFLAVVALFLHAVIGGYFEIRNNHDNILLGLTCAASMFGMYISFAALFFSFWLRWRLVFASLCLLLCNILLYGITFVMAMTLAPYH
ncbi:MAG: hypothetical protein FWD31_09670 [Planctomycetaceae bacterium]|nr:hypothetical protein [Planctomycetaceae bacterium]